MGERGRGVSGARESRRKCKRAIDSFQSVTSEYLIRPPAKGNLARAPANSATPRCISFAPPITGIAGEIHAGETVHLVGERTSYSAPTFRFVNQFRRRNDSAVGSRGCHVMRRASRAT